MRRRALLSGLLLGGLAVLRGALAVGPSAYLPLTDDGEEEPSPEPEPPPDEPPDEPEGDEPTTEPA